MVHYVLKTRNIVEIVILGNGVVSLELVQVVAGVFHLPTYLLKSCGAVEIVGGNCIEMMGVLVLHSSSILRYA